MAVVLTKYTANKGKVFDWKEPRYTDVLDEKGNPIGEKVQEHLYVKTLFIGDNDSVENYIEVDEDGIITELTAPEEATETINVNALAE